MLPPLSRLFVLFAVALMPTRSGVAQAPSSDARGVRVDFQHVNMHVAPGVILEIRSLQGTLVSTRPGQPPNFDDVRSYALRIRSGEVAVSASSLGALLNQRLFSGRDRAVSDVDVTIANGQVKQTGKLRKGVSIPFATVGSVSVTSDGRIRLHPTSIRAAGVPAAGLMTLLHLRLEHLIAPSPARGFTLDGNDMMIDPSRLLPNPRMSGTLTGVRVAGDRLIQTFGARPAAGPATGHRNYMHYTGNVLRFGRLTMSDTDLLLIDQDPKDAFEFAPAGYVEQLVAGYSKNAVDGSIRVYMPDRDDLPGQK